MYKCNPMCTRDISFKGSSFKEMTACKGQDL